MSELYCDSERWAERVVPLLYRYFGQKTTDRHVFTEEEARLDLLTIFAALGDTAVGAYDFPLRWRWTREATHTFFDAEIDWYS